MNSRSEDAFTTGRRSSGSIIAWSAACVLMVVAFGAGALIARGTSEAAGTQATEASDSGLPPAPDQETLDRAAAEWDAHLASGWVPFSNVSYPESVPVRGWVKLAKNQSGGFDYEAMKAEAPPDGEGIPIYDAPGGSVVGYSYNGLGVVSPEVARQGFDSGPALVARYGCDFAHGPALDRKACAESLAEGPQDAAIASTGGS